MKATEEPLTKEELLSKATSATSGLELWRLLMRYCASQGIERVSYHHHGYDARWGSELEANAHVLKDLRDVVAVSADPTFHIVAHGFPREWVERYVTDQLYEIDPIPDLAQRTTDPFFWSDVSNITRLAKEQADYLDRMKRSGVGDGVAIQVFGPNMRYGYVGFGFGGPKRDLSSAQLAEYQLVAQLLHLRACALLEQRNKGEVQLSPREREVLGWMARGKSKSVIADILGISVHTVDTTVRRIFQKLSVSDRTSAVIKAVSAGVIPAIVTAVT